jgi:hypothetical protein
MKIILFAIIVTLFTGCITQDKCNRKFPPQVATVDTVVIDKVITERDTVIETYTDIESIYALMECDSLNQVMITQIGMIKPGNHASITYKIINDTVYLSANCEAYKISLKLKDTVINSLQKQQKTVTVTEYKTSTFDLICRWYAIISLAIMALLGLLMWLRR